MKDKLRFAKRGAAVGLVVCFVAVIAVTGISVFSRYQRRNRGQLAKVEEEAGTKEKQDNNNPSQDTREANSPEIENKENEGKNDKNQSGEEAESPSDETAGSHITQQMDNPAFSAAADSLAWPIDGNVIMNYSMDHTVYFSTLDQYKYNPAIMISGEVGAEVCSAASGIVKSVDVTAQTGTTITVDLGNGYDAVYGQLYDVVVKEGNYVAKGAMIGYLNEPTKYYSVEGCNLYFQLLKDGEPVNPMEYLAE